MDPNDKRHGTYAGAVAHYKAREDRLVFRLGQVRELSPARIEVGVRGDSDGPPLGGRSTGDPLTRTQPRATGHLVERCAVGRAQHELAGGLVVEVDEARVGLERGGHLVGDEVQHLLEVECRIDRGDRLGEQPQVAIGRLHALIVGVPCR